MGKIDVAILVAMATAISVSAQEYSDAKEPLKKMRVSLR